MESARALIPPAGGSQTSIDVAEHATRQLKQHTALAPLILVLSDMLRTFSQQYGAVEMLCVDLKKQSCTSLYGFWIHVWVR
jgi:hypothetical protein